MKNVLIIVKKEFSRFFRDKRMVITVLLPGILIYLLYTLMGLLVTDTPTVDADYKFSAYVIEMPDNLSATFDNYFEIREFEDGQEAKQAVTDGSLDLVIIFPENFEIVSQGGTVDDTVEIYYNATENTSASGYYAVLGMLEELKNPPFTVNDGVIADIADERDSAGQILSMLVPMLMFAMLASGCVAVAPEAIAGEKERGTMATMLITPIKRWQLALGKIISLACFALLSGISGFLGVILSLPKLMAGQINGAAAAFYSVGDYFMIFALIISVVLVIISMFSILSAFAKSVKEAGTMISPVMIVIILVGLLAMFFPNPAVGLYAIPLLGSGFALSSIMTFTITPLGFALSIISNIVLAALLIVALSFMFRSERIMFNK